MRERTAREVPPLETQGLGLLSSAASVGSSVARLICRARSQDCVLSGTVGDMEVGTKWVKGRA